MTATRGLVVRQAGPGLALQDGGRPGFHTFGLSRGGAMDPVALAEAQALVGGAPAAAALEISAAGAGFEVFGGEVAVGLGGAEMRATSGDRILDWNASHILGAGARLDLRGLGRGGYGYVALGGGVDGKPVMGSLSRHFAVGLGPALTEGDRVGVAGPSFGGTPRRLLHGAGAGMDDRPFRILPGVHAHLFPEDARERFVGTAFRSSARANRMGRALDGGGGFATSGQLTIASEVVVPGDIQMVGDGQPYVLFNECQTTGGYPRIATVIAADLPRLAQLPPAAPVRFVWVTLEAALAAREDLRQAIAGAASRVGPRHRDPGDIGDLLSYQLVGGVVSGAEEEET